MHCFRARPSMWGGDAPPSGEGMSFSFNFGGEADAEPARAVDTKATTTSEDVIPGIEVLSVEVPFPTPGWTPETVQIGKHEFVKGASSGAKYASVTDLNLDGKQSSTSDLVKGKYEGGAKLWECAIDLCEYLLRMTTDKESLKNANVLELGCGHGLPGIVCVKLGAGHVTFADYNPDVLRSLTVPNVRANETKKECNRCSYRFLGGDWGSLCTTPGLLPPHQFDIILAAETVYEPSSFPKHIEILKRALRCDEESESNSSKKKKTFALVAAKSYYFGVGGGARWFRETLEKNACFDVECVDTISDGASNVREILKVSWTESFGQGR